MDKTDEKDIIVFGASGAGATFIEYAEKSGKYKILAVSDNDRAKHGDSFHGYNVISPASINNYSFDEIIIASTYFPEIIDQLVNELGVARDKVKVPPKSTTGNKKSYRPFEDAATLKLAREVLLKVCELLEQAEIRYFVDHGTLLGIVRDGDLIPWDDDIDLSVEIGDIPAVIKLLQEHIGDMPQAETIDWKLLANYREDDIPVKVLLYFDESQEHAYRPFPLSIEIFEFIEGQAVQELSYSDDYHYLSNIYLDYQGSKLSAPFDYENYLTMHYGDWKIIKKDATFLDAKNYKTPNRTCKKELKKRNLPEISVAMTVYNGEKYLRESIDSILAQSFEDFELIIVDDGSTDNTLEIIKEYKDSRIKVHKLEENQGVGAASKVSVELAQGKYIAIADDDDIYHKDRFKLQKEYLDKHPDITLVKSLVSYFGNEEVEKSARFKGIKQNLEKGKNEAITSEEIKRTLDWHICIPHSSIMARTEIMKEFQYNDYRMGEDYDLFTRLNRAGHKMGTVERILTYVRVSTESLTATSRATLYRTIYDIKREYIDNFFTNGNVYLWGASTMGQYADKVLEEKGLYISGFIDIDENKQGKKLNGKTIYGPEVLNYKSKIITTSIPGRESIVKDLEARGMKQFEDYIVFL